MSQPTVLKVMLVEDDPQFVYLLQRYARSSGCQLVHTGSAGEAVLLALKERPDLILLDTILGATEGWQILRALKADPTACKIPVFVCSASEAALRAYEEQADGCLLKPVMYEDFLAALAEIKLHLPADAPG